NRRRGGPGSGVSGPTTGSRGLAMPTSGAPAPSGPSTGGPTGPTAGGPAGPATPGGAPGAYASQPEAPALAGFGRARTGKAAVEESKAISTGSDDFYLGSTRKLSSKDRAKAGQWEQGDSEQLLHRAAGRVFVKVGAELVEQGLPEDWRKQAVVLESFSKDYF